MRNSASQDSAFDMATRAASYTTVFGRIDNLLNERYQKPTAFDRSGFWIFGGIRVATADGARGYDSAVCC